jgi:hypothetical protein
MKNLSSYHRIYYMQKLSPNELATGFHLRSDRILRQVWMIHVLVPQYSSRGMRHSILLLEDKWTRKVTRMFSSTSITTTTITITTRFLLTPAVET